MILSRDQREDVQPILGAEALKLRRCLDDKRQLSELDGAPEASI
jgi:hypothetical protein